MASTERASAAPGAPPRGAAQAGHPNAASRILFTIGALLVCRLGTQVPLPGIDPAAWQMMERHYHRVADVIGGGGTNRAAILTLGLMPFFNAALFVEVVSMFLRKHDRRAVNRRTRYLAVVLAAAQSYGIAVAFEQFGEAVVADPGWAFRLSTVATLTGGTALLLWLADEITVRGVGNGLVLVILSGMVAGLPDAAAAGLGYGAGGQLAIAGVATIAVTAFVVVMAGARPSTPSAEARAFGGVGVVAPVYALLFSGGGHPVLAAVLTVLFAGFWTARTRTGGVTRQDLLDVFAAARKDTADGNSGDGAPGTGRSVMAAARRLGLVGGLQLAAAGAAMDVVFALPSADGMWLPFPFAGTVVVIIVAGALDTLAAVRASLKSPAAGR